MKKIEQYKYAFILFVLFFTLIPQIKAKTITTTYNNYYFFLEPYKVCFGSGIDCDIIIENGKGDTPASNNETGFIRLKLAASEGSYEKIDLFNNNSEWCDGAQGSCLEKFYAKLIEIEDKGTEGNISNIGNFPCTSKYIVEKESESKINTYFSHGYYRSYSKNNENEWLCPGNVQWEYTDNKSILACASVNINVNGTFTYQNSIISKAYLQSRIARNQTTVNNIQNTEFNNNINSSNCGGKTYPIKGEDEKYRILSPVLYKYTYTTTSEVCDRNLTKSDTGKCNSSDNTLSSTCKKQTIETSNSRADVFINETGTVSNILTPNSVYQGGGFKFGFVYYNEISWNFDGNIYTTLISQSDAKKEIIEAMKKKIQSVGTFQDSITLDNILFGNETIDSSLIQKSCQRSGEFNPGETVTTICTFYLPNSVVEPYTGKISYSTSIGTNYGINNKYYTPLTYEGKYNIKATLKNLNILINDEDWVGDWSLTFDGSKDSSCQIDVVKRLYDKVDDKAYSFAFIYRPIDLNDPFPNRNAGVNWYAWYSKTSNKERLEESYSNLQYQVKLDNKTTYDIKEYNGKNSYLSWEGINESGESSFIDKYFNIYRNNIEGDNP
ncbi:MAG: hypothetical protein ACI310_00195 [Bacilli bacterium]